MPLFSLNPGLSAAPRLAMPSLPSFVELMASLGLQNETRGSDRASFSSASSSSTTSSPRLNSAFTTPQTSPPHTNSPAFPPQSPTRMLDSDRHRSLGRKQARAARFSPYLSDNVHSRRGSLPVIHVDQNRERDQLIRDRDMRSAPTSPRTRTPPTRHTAMPVDRHSRRSPDRSDDSDAVPVAYISSILRRRTPQTSPVSATFPHRRPSPAPDTIISPVALPTLPSMLRGPNASASMAQTDGALSRDSLRVNMPARESLSARRANRAVGLRVSTYRSPTQESHCNVRVSPPSPLRSAT